MFLMILSSATVDTGYNGALIGYGLLLIFIIVLALSPQRWLLGFLLGAMVYWLAVEVVNSVLLNWSTLSDWHSYVAAMSICWLPLFSWVLYRVLRYDNVSMVKPPEDAESARYTEHTPIYDDDYQPRFE